MQLGQKAMWTNLRSKQLPDTMDASVHIPRISPLPSFRSLSPVLQLNALLRSPGPPQDRRAWSLLVPIQLVHIAKHCIPECRRSSACGTCRHGPLHSIINAALQAVMRSYGFIQCQRYTHNTTPASAECRSAPSQHPLRIYTLPSMHRTACAHSLYAELRHQQPLTGAQPCALEPCYAVLCPSRTEIWKP